MIRIAAALAIGILLASCGGRPARVRDGVQEVFAEADRSPEREAGWCERCNFSAFEGHRCGLTSPCSLCGIEKGARHLHEVQWTCTVDDVVMSEQHECRDAKTCWTCRRDHRGGIPTKGCERCYNQAAATQLQAITVYCAVCNLEVGANHLHGKSIFCRPCLREAGAGHIHDATRLCVVHETEHDPDHLCGTTEYCRKCHRDAGVDHKHGVTEWCWKCESEMEWPHAFH